MIIKQLKYLALVFSIIVLFSLTGCGGGSSTPTPPPPPPAGWFDDVNGVWKQQGYGNVMVVSGTEYEFYQLNQSSCIKQETSSIASLEAILRNKQKNASLDQISIEYISNYAPLVFDKIAQLPSLCENGGTAANSDPELNFDALWNTFNEQYAFFDVRNVNWDTSYANFRNQVTSATSEQELFSIVREMLKELGDGHVSLSSDSETVNAGATSMLQQRIYDDFANQSEIQNLDDYIAQQLAIIETTIVGYLDGQVAQGANDKLAWGNLSPNIGYLSIKEMTDFTGDSNATDQQNLEALKPVIQQAMTDLSETQALVIDLRLNGGGQGYVALEIASYFVQQEAPVFTVKARFDNDYTTPTTITLQPSATSAYTGEVILLTSGITASAAETFIISLLERGQLTLLGEQTVGIFSNQLNRKLPNGWSFTLSNEVIEVNDGTSYESTGIIPDVAQTIFPLVDRENGVDSALDKAIELLSNKGIY